MKCCYIQFIHNVVFGIRLLPYDMCYIFNLIASVSTKHCNVRLPISHSKTFMRQPARTRSINSYVKDKSGKARRFG